MLAPRSLRLPSVVRPSAHPPRRTAAVATLLASSAWWLGVAPAYAQEQDPEDEILRYEMTVELHDDGSADVVLELDIDLGDSPNHGPYLTYLVKQQFDDTQDRVYRMTDVRASSATGAPSEVQVEEEGALLVVRIGDEDVEVQGVQTYQVTYKVDGWVSSAAMTGEDDELFLNVLGGWEIPVRDIQVTVTGPAEVIEAACFVGIPQSEEPCLASGTQGQSATFQHGVVAPGDHLTVVTAFPAGTFGRVEPLLQDRWAFGRAFAATPLTLGATALVALLGGSALLRRVRRPRRDEHLGLTHGLEPLPGQLAGFGNRRGTVRPVQLVPPAGFRPGQLGTLLDGTADPRDVTGTLIDLAVRGFLRIEQTSGPDAGGDSGTWRLVRLHGPDDGTLLPYERMLLQEVFEGRDTVELADLRTTFAASMAKVQSALYEDVAERGWFRGNPHVARTRWVVRSLLVLVAGVALTVLLAVWTSLALIGVPFMVLGVAALLLTGSAATRTPAGTAVLVEAQAFREHLATAESSELQVGRGEDLFSRYLPYAVAFGLTERWTRTFAGLAAQGHELAVPVWYVGSMSHGLLWTEAGTFTRDLTSFTSVASAALSAPTPGSSGSSGSSGGFAGGRVGGGGGGSW